MFQASKSTAKASLPPLDDDDDFLSKPSPKKTTKPAVEDDDDFLSKGPAKKTTKPPADNGDFLSKGPSKKTTKPVVEDDDDNDFLQKGSTKKTTKPPADDGDFLSKGSAKRSAKAEMDDDNIFAGVKTRGQPVNKAKKSWDILGKPEDKGSFFILLLLSNETLVYLDDIFNNVPTKPSSNASKPKSTTGGSKTKTFDDIFDDPLDVRSK